MNDKELVHVGILGMRWGVRRSQSSSSGSTSRSSKRLSYEEREQRRRDVTKKAAKLVAVGIAAYGTYKLGKYIKAHPEKIALAKKKVKNMLSSGKIKRKFTPEEIRKNQELRLAYGKKMAENKKIFEELKRSQKDYQFTPDDFQKAINSLKRQGVG